MVDTYSSHLAEATSTICKQLDAVVIGERAACAALFTAYLAAKSTYDSKVDGLSRCWGKDAYDCRREVYDASRALRDATQRLNRIMGDTPITVPE